MLRTISLGVGAEITGFAPMTIAIPWNGIVRGAVSWKNIGTQAYAFDVVVFYGDYDPTTHTFTAIAGAAVLDQSIAAWTTTTTNVDMIYNQSALRGIRDALAILGDYNTATGEIINTYAQLLSENAVDFQAPAVGAEITGVTFSSV